MIALGRDLDDALAVEVEILCEQYWCILQISHGQLGEPRTLTVLFNAKHLQHASPYSVLHIALPTSLRRVYLV